MTEKRQVYKCLVCGMVVEVLDGGAGQLVCCGQPMRLMTARDEPAHAGLHRPVIALADGGVKVTVGPDGPHPMEGRHFVQWIDLLVDGMQYRRYLSPGDKPEALFPVAGRDMTAREFCNLHGLWKGQ